MRWFYSLCICFFFLSAGVDEANARSIYFDKYSAEDGMTSNWVHRIEQDSCGHIWATTDFGISRFDGKFFKKFVRSNYPSMMQDELHEVKSYPDGSFFVGGNAGALLKYNPVKDCFEDYSPVDFQTTYLKQVDGFYLLRDQRKLAFTSGGIYFLDEKKGGFSNDFPAFDAFKDYYILSFYEDRFGRFWIASFNTLIITTPDGTVVKKLDLGRDLESMFSSKLIPLSENKILVTCFTNVLYIITIDANGDVLEPVQIKVPFSNLNKVLKDKHGNFWYSSDGDGLWCSNVEPSENTEYEKIYPSNLPEKYLSKIYDIEESSNGDIWVATYSNGMLRFHPNKPQLFVFSKDVQFPMQMGSSFSETDNHDIFVSCDGGGLARLSSDYKVIEIYNEKYGLTSKNVVSHSQDKDGHLWLATWGGGILEFDPSTCKYRQEKFPGLNSNLSCFAHVTKLSNGEIWVSTGGDGMYKRDVTGKWSRYMLKFSENEFDMWPYRVIEGKNNDRWISTSRSVWYVNGENRKPMLGDFSKSPDSNPMSVNDLMVAEDGSLYVATDRSIIKISKDAQKCDTLRYLPVAKYSSINIGGNGKILVSGTDGIIEIDEVNEKYKALNYNFAKQGFNYFRSHSSLKTSDGRILWGTKDGFVVQNNLADQMLSPIECFELSEVKVADLSNEEAEKYIDRSDKGVVQSLSLPYDKTDISIFVDWVDLSSREVEFKYCLRGFSDKYIPLPDNRYIYFSYIPSGDYELEVLSVCGDDVQKRCMKIKVMPPWWKTWWFTLLCILLALVIVGGVFYIRLRRLTLQRAELRRMVEERTKELDLKNVKIEEQNEELKHVLADKDRVLSVIAHDLKNPMFAIVGALEGWIRREPAMNNEEKRAVISNVLSSSQSLQSEMGRLLEWARAKSDRIDFNPTNVDLNSVVRNVASLLSTLLSKKKISLKTDVDLEECVWGDNRMLSTIFRNFINNSIKFTPEGGEIVVSARKINEDRVEVTIKDNGVGMSADKLATLQSQGYCDSSLGTDNEKGTGLGFRICRDYIERNNGTLKLFSKESEGTTIQLEFPLSKQKVSELVPTLNADKEKLDKTIDKEILEGNKVVVVDDDSLISKNISDILSSYMEVFTASNGEEALELIKRVEPDLILSDVEMPVMNGIELSRHLAREEDTNSIPFLFLSAKNEESDRLLGLLSGAIDYIPKPFSASELLMKVNNILRIRQRQQSRLLNKQYYQKGKEVDSKESTVEKKEDKDEKLNPFVMKLMDVVGKHYIDSDYSIESLASELNMSQSTLSRRVKSLLGKTPIEVMNEYRLNMAMSLLKEAGKETNIASIAYEVGFTDPAYFTKKFKDFFGILPSNIK